MLVLYLKTGERVVVEQALKLAETHSLLLVRYESGLTVQVFAADEIDRLVEESEEDETAAAA